MPRGELKPIAPDTIYYPTTMRIGCGKLKVMIGYSPSERAIQDLYVIRSGVGGCEKIFRQWQYICQEYLD